MSLKQSLKSGSLSKSRRAIVDTDEEIEDESSKQIDIVLQSFSKDDKFLATAEIDNIEGA
jgi:hypothetical protein